MIIIVEGLDSSGKTTLIKTISDNFKNFNFKSIINSSSTHRFVNFEEQPYEWKHFVAGIIYSSLDMFKNFDFFIKDRFHLSEYAYTHYFNRESFYTFENIEESLLLLNKDIRLIFCDVDYNEYKRRHLDRNQKFLSQEEFSKQRILFHEAFKMSKLTKYFLNTNIDQYIQEQLENFIGGVYDSL